MEMVLEMLLASILCTAATALAQRMLQAPRQGCFSTAASQYCSAGQRYKSTAVQMHRHAKGAGRLEAKATSSSKGAGQKQERKPIGTAADCTSLARQLLQQYAVSRACLLPPIAESDEVDVLLAGDDSCEAPEGATGTSEGHRATDVAPAQQASPAAEAAEAAAGRHPPGQPHLQGQHLEHNQQQQQQQQVEEPDQLAQREQLVQQPVYAHHSPPESQANDNDTGTSDATATSTSSSNTYTPEVVPQMLSLATSSMVQAATRPAVTLDLHRLLQVAAHTAGGRRRPSALYGQCCYGAVCVSAKVRPVEPSSRWVKLSKEGE